MSYDKYKKTLEEKIADFYYPDLQGEEREQLLDFLYNMPEDNFNGLLEQYEKDIKK